MPAALSRTTWRSPSARPGGTRALRRLARLLVAPLGLALVSPALAQPVSAAPSLPGLVGSPLVVDVPAPADARLFDVHPFRTGTQVLAQAFYDARANRIGLVSVLDLRLLAETTEVGFVPRGSVGAGWRVFLWGDDGTGQARLWAPAFDASRQFHSFDPEIPCADASDASTPVAGPFSVTIPPSVRPGGRFIPSPASALVFGDPADAANGVRIATGNGITLGVATAGTNIAQGGFGFAGAAFAYGTNDGRPMLWTPELVGTSTRLRAVGFLACAEQPPVDPGRLSVRSSADTTRGATKALGPLGGTVEAAAADGTLYSLFVPPGALGASVEITVTPTAVGGLESIASEVPFAVELAPSGLTFATPARLMITPTARATVDFATSWREGTPGVEIAPVRAGPGGSFVVDVVHFSGVATIRSTIHTYNTLLTLALVGLPDYQGLKQQLVSHVLGLPGSAPDVANDVQQIYANHVKPYLDDADAGIVELQVASRRLAELEGLYQMMDLGRIAQGTGTLQDLLDDAGTLFATKGTAFVGHFTTACDGQVSDLTDWFAIPILALAELRLRNVILPVDYCAHAAVDAVAWPARINPNDTTVNGTLRGVISAPGHTPGGILEDGRKLFPQPTEFELHANGATFAGGASDIDQITPSDGISRLDLQLDRQAGPQSLTVNGIASVYGFTAEVIAVDSSFENLFPVRLGASTGTIAVDFRSPPTNVVLRMGQTTNLCVDVFDGDGLAIDGAAVAWSLAGPGSLAGAASTTNSLGSACVDYRHPAGPVNQGDTVSIGASVTYQGDTGGDAVTLTPEWAHIEIETELPDDHTGYQTSTNGVVSVRYGDSVTLRVTLTGPGATPSDPPQRIAASPIQVMIDSGGGYLTYWQVVGGDLVLTEVPRLFRTSTDANGQVVLRWIAHETPHDETIVTANPTIRVDYPPPLLGVPGIAATVGFDIGPDAPPGPCCEL